MEVREIAISLIILVLGVWSRYAFVAQVVRHRTVSGLSMSTILMSAWMSASWAIYGVINNQLVQIATNSLGVLCALFVLHVGRRQRCVDSAKFMVLTLIWTVLLYGAHTFGGAMAYGTLISLAVFVVGAPQMWEAWKRPGGMGVSISSNLISCIQCICWIAYGALQGDFWVVVTSAYVVAQLLFLIARTIQARRRVVQPAYPRTELLARAY